MSGFTSAALCLMLAAAAAAAGAPDSIVGVWEIDLDRTLREHVKRIAQHRPDLMTDSVRQDVTSTPATAQASRTTLTITEDTITSAGAHTETTTLRYRLIGGHSRLAIVQSTDDAGNEIVVHIRLVESGIAVETMNCADDPEACERARQRAPGAPGQVPRTAGGSDADTAADGTLRAAGKGVDSPSVRVDGPTERVYGSPQLQWVYFKRAE